MCRAGLFRVIPLAVPDRGQVLCLVRCPESPFAERRIHFGYKKVFSGFCETYRLECEKNKIDYVKVNTSDSLDKSLIEYLIKRSRLA